MGLKRAERIVYSTPSRLYPKEGKEVKRVEVKEGRIVEVINSE